MSNGLEPSPAWPEFLDLLETLSIDSVRTGTSILVEGERDRLSLRKLGISGPIHLVHRGRSLSHRAQELARPGHTLIVLTDWDVEGGHLARRLRELLAPGPARVDLEYRRRLSRILRGEVAQVEGLAGWARRMAERAGAPLEHFLRPASA